MKTSSLLGTTFAALLIASPGLALAESGNGNAVPAEHSPITGANSRDNATNQQNNNADSLAQLGTQGYDGTATPIHHGNNGNENNNGNNNNASNMRPSQRNPLLADNGAVRAGKVIGTDVYNDQNKQIGSVSGILIGRHETWAVISNNGRQVTVPFSELVFGDANAYGHDKLVLPNVTDAHLNSMPAFHYNETNNNNNGGNNTTGANGNSNRG